VRTNLSILFSILAALAVGGVIIVGITMFKENTLRVASYYLLRFMISAILVWVAFACLAEVYRLWFIRPVNLGPFAYVKDGSETRETGALFARQVNQDLLIIQGLLKGEPAERLPNGSGKVRAETFAARITDLGLLADLQIPSLPATSLDLEIQIQGIKVTELFRTLMNLVHPPDEVVGTVSERNNQVTAQVELRHALGRQAPIPPQETRDQESLEHTSFAIACRILYLLASDKDPAVLTTYAPEELEIYLRALRQFGLFNVYKNEARADPAKKQEAALAEADRLLTKLTGDHTNLDPAYKLASLVAFAKGDGVRGQRLLGEYLARRKESGMTGQDRPAEKLQQFVKPMHTATFDPRSPKTKLQPGVSVSGTWRPRRSRLRPVLPGLVGQVGPGRFT
jgi:hypothetical protein